MQALSARRTLGPTRPFRPAPKPRQRPSAWAPDELHRVVADVVAGTSLRVRAPLGDGWVDVRPLTEEDLDQASIAADAYLASRRVTKEAAPEMAERALEREVVLRATMGDEGTAFFASVGQVMRLDPSSVTTLADAAAQALKRARPANDAAEGLPLADAIKANASPLDRVRARHAQALASFYGVSSVRVLTDWQVITWMKLMEDDSVLSR